VGHTVAIDKEAYRATSRIVETGENFHEIVLQAIDIAVPPRSIGRKVVLQHSSNGL
jgi:hypothetical protein